MKKMISFMLSIWFLFSISGNLVSANYSLDTESGIFLSETTISEYQMAINETAENNLSQTNSEVKTPLQEYKESFDARAQLDTTVLTGMGYTKEEIEVLQKYNEGKYTFEEAASRASAVLTTTLTCPTHTSQLYTLKYEWLWDKTPSGLGIDGIGLGAVGFDSENLSIGTVSNEQTTYAHVYYYYLDGTYYRSESASVTKTGSNATAQFDTYKINSNSTRWVWAKNGYLQISISPNLDTGRTLANVRAGADYGHSTNDATQFSISVDVNPAASSITTTFSVTNGVGTVTKCGRWQKVFYNSGTCITESSP